MIHEYTRPDHICQWVENEDDHNRIIIHLHDVMGAKALRQILVRTKVGDFFAWETPERLDCDISV